MKSATKSYGDRTMILLRTNRILNKLVSRQINKSISRSLLKKKKITSAILMIEIKFEEHIYKNDIVNHLLQDNLEK
jgi:hypothetical protein